MEKKMGNKSRRIGQVCLVLLLTVLTLSACTREAEEEKIEITLMHGWGGTPETHKTMQTIYEDFSKKNPDITLKCIAYSDSSIVVEQANDMLAVGEMPDIISTNGLSYYVDHAVKRGMAMDLMPQIEQDEELKNMIPPSVYESWKTEQGSLYTVPDALEVAGYWYNENYLKAAGIMDENGNVETPDTWGSFFNMLHQLDTWVKETGQDISVCSLDQLQLVEFLFPARLASADERGMELVQGQSGNFEPEILSPVMKDMETLSLVSKHVDNIENARQDFFSGKSILYFNGIWECNERQDQIAVEEISYSAYPYGEAEKLAYVSASSGYVFKAQKDEKREEAVIRFLKYMLSTDVQEKLAVKTGQMPVNPNINTARVKEENPLLAEAMDKVYEAPVQIRMIRSVWNENQVNVVDKYIRENRYSETDIQSMAEELNQNR